MRHYYELFPSAAPLTQARETELITKALAGCPVAEDVLTRQYAGVGISMALRYRLQRAYQGVDVDSLVSAALFGVVEGIRHFDKTRGARLITCIWWWVRCYVGRERINHRFVKHGAFTYMTDFMLGSSDVSQQESCASDQPDVSAVLEDEEEREELMRLMDNILDEREIEIVNRRYAICREDVETLVTIGESLKISRQRVSQIEVAAVEKLKRAVGV